MFNTLLSPPPVQINAFLLLTIATASTASMGLLALRHRKITRRLNELSDVSTWQQLTINSSKLLFISTEPDGTIKLLNSSAAKLLGYSNEELVGKTTPALWHLPEEVKTHADEINTKYNLQLKPGFDSIVWEAQHNIESEREWTFRSKDGKLHPVSLTVYALRNRQGSLVGYAGIIKDLSETHQQQQILRLRESQIIASGKMAALGEMAAGIAHEINNPLTIITGNAAALKKSLALQNSPDEQQRLDKILQTVQRIARIIKGMKTLARGEATDNQVGRLDNIVEDALSVCRERFKSHGVDLKIEKIPSLEIQGQHSQLSQVLLNLLSNSFDAIVHSEDLDKWIRLEFQIKTNQLEIIVTDSGLGITEEVQKRLMQPFFTTKEVGVGLGLGLSLSRQIMNKHKGDLKYNPLCKNTQFIMTLPFLQSAQDTNHGTLPSDPPK